MFYLAYGSMQGDWSHYLIGLGCFVIGYFCALVVTGWFDRRSK